MRGSPQVKVFSIFKDGEYLGEGTRAELSLWFNRRVGEISKAVKKGQDVDGYQIVPNGSIPKYALEKDNKSKPVYKAPKEKETDLQKDHLEFLKWHLNFYGNTSVQFDPVPYIPDLYDAGINCRVKEIYDDPENHRVTKRGRKPKPKVHYYVEVVKNEAKGFGTSI